MVGHLLSDLSKGGSRKCDVTKVMCCCHVLFNDPSEQISMREDTLEREDSKNGSMDIGIA